MPVDKDGNREMDGEFIIFKKFLKKGVKYSDFHPINILNRNLKVVNKLITGVF